MCVRDLIRGTCPVSKRTSAAKLHESNNVSVSKSSGKRARRMRGEDEVDLFCTELLSQGDAHTYHADISYSLKIDCEPLSPLMVDIPSALRAAVDPSLYSILLSPVADDCSYLQQRPWTGVEGVPSPFGYAQELSVGIGAGDDEGIIDGVGGQDCSPEHHFNSPLATDNLWQPVEAGAYLPFGNSLQSKSLPCEQWTTQACGPCSFDKERRSTESIASSRSRKKSEFSFSPETLHSDISTSYLERNSLSSGPEKICSKIRSVCSLEFREAMQFLLEKESAANYQLSSVYIERLTGKSGQKLEINGIRSTRRNFVKWILKVVEHLHLSSPIAANAVSLFDRNLSHRLAVDTQIDGNDELLLAATACVWIAAKLEDSSVPQLSCIQALVGVGFDDVKFRKMEIAVLSSLGWRTLGATANDFLVNMIAQLPALGLPAHLLTSLVCRSEEVMRILLPEVEFLAYQPSVVSFSVMQCLLDEIVPVQTASLMAAFHLALAVDVVYIFIQKTIIGEISLSLLEKRILSGQFLLLSAKLLRRFTTITCIHDVPNECIQNAPVGQFELTLCLNEEPKGDCNRAVKNIVKTTQITSILQPQARGYCADFKKLSDLHSGSSNPDTLNEQTARLPIPAF